MKLFDTAYVVVNGDYIVNGKTRVYITMSQAKAQLTRKINDFNKSKAGIEKTLASIDETHRNYQYYSNLYNNFYKDKDHNYRILVTSLDWKPWSA